MILALLALGVSAVVGTVLGGGSGAGSGSGGAEELVFDDDEQLVVSEEARGPIVSFLDDLVADGEIAQSDLDMILGRTDFVAGPLSVNTGGGDDGVLGSGSADRITAGEGDDNVLGGAGADEIRLGAGNDVSGVDHRIAEIAPDEDDAAMQLGEAFLEGGDDVIHAGTGDDVVADGYGSNELHGGVGSDALISVDQDGLTPDVVDGGFGNDLLIVDEGDTVTTGGQSDVVVVDVFAGVEPGYDAVTITDFDPDRDVIVLEGDDLLLLAPDSADPEVAAENPITVEDTEDGTGAIVSIGGIPVVVVTGGQGLSVEDVLISV